MNDLNSTPIITCILPIYNGYPDLIKSIDSVLEQSYKNFELIIVNDGSTDLTHDYSHKILFCVAK